MTASPASIDVSDDEWSSLLSARRRCSLDAGSLDGPKSSPSTIPALPHPAPAAAPAVSSLSVRALAGLSRRHGRPRPPAGEVATAYQRRKSLGAAPFPSPASFHSPPMPSILDPFFETESIRVLPRSFHSTGEVPEVFRHKPVTLTAATSRITTHHSPFGRGPLSNLRTGGVGVGVGGGGGGGGASDFHALFTVKVHNQAPFNPSCESICIEAGFLIARVVMEPLNISNSQAVARGTTVTVELFAGRRPLVCMQSTLSALVWEDSAAVLVGPSKRRLDPMACPSKRVGVGGVGVGVGVGVSGQALRRRPVDWLFAEPLERDRPRRSDVVEMHVGLSRRLSLRRMGRTLLFALSRFESGGGGGVNAWKVFYRSKLTAGSAPLPKCFSRQFLLDNKADLAQTLRFSLLEMKDAFSSRLVAHSDLSFESLADYTGDFPCKAETHQESVGFPVSLKVLSFMQREDGLLQLAILWELGGRVA